MNKKTEAREVKFLDQEHPFNICWTGVMPSLSDPKSVLSLPGCSFNIEGLLFICSGNEANTPVTMDQ